MDSRDYPEAYLTDELESYGTMNHAIDKAAARIKKLETLVAQQTAVIEQMREALQLCRSHMYCHASNTGDNAFDKLCSALALQPCPEYAQRIEKGEA